VNRYDDIRKRGDREHRQFDQMWRIVFPVAVTLGVLGSLATIALYAGAAAWLWGVIP
jgi:hypothetical protein